MDQLMIFNRFNIFLVIFELKEKLHIKICQMELRA